MALCGSAWSRCKNLFFLAFLRCADEFFARIGVVEVQKLVFFLRFLRCRGSALSRCKNLFFFAILAVPARPSAGIGVVEVQKIGVVEVQKLEFFLCDSGGTRATLCGDRRAKTRVFFLVPA